MAMDHDEHVRLEEWAKNYGGTAILGFICTLLILGKFLHHVFQRRGLICGTLIIPPSLLSGILGLIWFAIMDKVDPEMTGDLGSGLESIKMNLINFVFAALILGLTCTRTTSHHNRYCCYLDAYF
jgi:Na+/glutamate symporter